METLCVVLYQNDPRIAQVLAVSLSQHFDSVHLARTCEEVRPAVARHRAEALVLDLETSGPDEVDRLHREFPGLCIVGTHRLADDKLWAEAMSLARPTYVSRATMTWCAPCYTPCRTGSCTMRPPDHSWRSLFEKGRP
jgi:hypothetical protein